MCNHERVVDFLYDELSASDRLAVERHLKECAACRTELAELSGTRMALASWSPPDSELGFTIVRKAAPEPQRSAWTFRPAWGLAAAAVLVLGVAAAIANLEVRYDSNGLIVRTGWANAAQSAPVAPASAGTVATTSEEWKANLEQLDARLQQLEQARPRTVSAANTVDESAAAAPQGGRTSDEQLLRVVRRMIAESNAAQQRELAYRVTQVIRDFDSARAGDLARIEQGLRQIQGLTDAELIRHRDTLNHLLRVTQQR